MKIAFHYKLFVVGADFSISDSHHISVATKKTPRIFAVLLQLF